MNDEEEVSETTEEEYTTGFSPRWGRIVLIVVVLAISATVYFAYSNNHYTGYSVQGRITHKSSDNTNYLSLDGKLFSYSRDGAELATFDGAPVWNVSFDMENPVCDISGSYVMLYDRERTLVYIFNPSGLQGSLSMTLPIVRANVASNGNVAVLMQDDETAYLRLYDTSGVVLVSGELHAQNTGYPVAMDISDDARGLMISLLDLNNGDLKTTICFYDFSASGKSKENHISADFSYADVVFPEVHYFKDTAVAFGDEELVFFRTGREVSIEKEVFLEDQVKNIFFSDERAAVVTTKETPNGGRENILHTYTATGAVKFREHLSGNMSYMEYMDNGEILMHNGNIVRIYKDDGRQKLSTKTEESIRTVIPWDGQRNYYFITKNQTQKVVLQ